MTTRRSFIGLLGACVLAVSTSIPVLNRDQVTPNRPPTVEVVRCEKCGWVPSEITVESSATRWRRPWTWPSERVDRAAALAERVIVQASEADILDGNCFVCENGGLRMQAPPDHPWDTTLEFRSSYARIGEPETGGPR